MTRVRITAFGMAIGFLLAAGSVNAATIQWDLFGGNSGGITWDPPPAACSGTTKSTNNCDLGVMATYTASGRTIEFSGFTDGGVLTDSPTAIVENNRGSNDRGLGVLGANDEVDTDQYIMVDLGANFGDMTNWMVMFDSIDGNEISQLGTTKHGSELLTTTTPRQWLMFTPLTKVFYFNTAGGGSSDTLLKALKADTVPVPEPMTIALLGLGLAGLGVWRRRAVSIP